MKARFFDIAVFGALFVCIVFCLGFENDCTGIRENVLRLHIIADSDAPQAQQLKYKVRDSILAEGAGLFSKNGDILLAEDTVRKNLSTFEQIALEKVRAEGYTYSVSAEITRCYFPTRQYGDIVLPAGEYEALRIILGEGKGQNWWCVMFPPMCLPAASEKEAELADVLDEKELGIVTEPGKYKVRLWIVEKWYEVKEYFDKE